ncbi:uncharacterized protein JCM15063_002509 [Sporobolomyces koalae]|uniref:uncharacterized protein n=1 Tax=Sporobolomyces koalae TaxID=500713 RepID=UPI0031781E2F
MSTSSPEYKPLSRVEKSPQPPSDVEYTINEQSPASLSSTPRGAHVVGQYPRLYSLRVLFKTIIWTLLILLTGSICLLASAFVGKHLAELVKPGGIVHVVETETVTRYVTVTAPSGNDVLGKWKWWDKRSLADGRDGAQDDDRYSTSTLRDGSTQTFVFTTRPIVNPGGYTIGTLTGYVPVSSTTGDAGRTTSATSEAKPTITTHSSSSRASTRSTSTIPESSSTSTSHRHSSKSSSSATSTADHNETSWSRVSTTSIPSTSATPTSTASHALQEEEMDFSQVDYHLLHRRGLDFEQGEDDASSTPVSSITSVPTATMTSSVEEFSTSTDRHGSLYTLVKTTRPIVNPGGYTIGTLDGGWIDVDKVKPTRAPVAEKRTHPVHEELKKREVVYL